MMCPHYSEPVEKYSSYKKRKFEKTKSKLKLLISGINQLSLKEKDKKLLREQCKEIIQKQPNEN